METAPDASESANAACRQAKAKICAFVGRAKDSMVLSPTMEAKTPPAPLASQTSLAGGLGLGASDFLVSA